MQTIECHHAELPADPARPQRTVGWVLDYFFKNGRRPTSKVAATEQRRILELFRHYVNSDRRQLGELPVAACTGADLVEFLASKLSGRSQWTRRRWLGAVKRPFKLAAELGAIAFSPFAAVKEPRGRRGRDLTSEEFRALLRLANPTLRRLLIFLRLTGARPGELRVLEWGHLCLSGTTGTITLHEHKTAHSLKEPRPRIILLGDTLVKLIRWMKRNHPHGGRFVFVNSFGGHWKIGSLCKSIRALRAKAELPPDAKLYGTRHAYITGALTLGVDVATVAELVGHASILTTQGYIHLGNKTAHLAAAVERAGHFNGNVPAPAAAAPPAAPSMALLAQLRELLAAIAASQGDVGKEGNP